MSCDLLIEVESIDELTIDATTCDEEIAISIADVEEVAVEAFDYPPEIEAIQQELAAQMQAIASNSSAIAALNQSVTELDERVGVLENNPVIVDSKTNDLGSIAGAVSVNLNNGTYVTGKPTGAIQLSFSGLPENGYVKDFTLLLDSIVEITFPINTKFVGGVPPTVIATPYLFVCQIDSDGIVTVYSVIDNIKVPV
ncbi:MAG: hypothetical protein JW783_00400 [Bacteroidales bacterium]|nr:hypothetical protein [Bacteroidales bacterium]MBN2748481.1 hypothetical protein [Bacteroidales bacterium]